MRQHYGYNEDVTQLFIFGMAYKDLKLCSFSMVCMIKTWPLATWCEPEEVWVYNSTLKLGERNSAIVLTFTGFRIWFQVLTRKQDVHSVEAAMHNEKQPDPKANCVLRNWVLFQLGGILVRRTPTASQRGALSRPGETVRISTGRPFKPQRRPTRTQWQVF